MAEAPDIQVRLYVTHGEPPDPDPKTNILVAVFIAGGVFLWGFVVGAAFGCN